MISPSYITKNNMVVNEHGDQDDAQKIPHSDSLIGMKKTETFIHRKSAKSNTWL